MRVRHVPVGLAGRRGEVPETRADVARRPAAAAAARRRQRVLGTRHSRHTSPAHGTSGAGQTAHGTRSAQFGKQLSVCGKRYSEYSARGTFGTPVRHTTEFGIRQLSARGTSGARQTARGTRTAQFGKRLPVCGRRYSEYSARGTFGSPVQHTALPVRGKQHTAHGRHSSVNNFRCAENGTASTRHAAMSAHQSGTRHRPTLGTRQLPVRGKQHTAHGRHSSVDNFRCAAHGTASTRKGMTGGRYRWNRRRPDDPHRNRPDIAAEKVARGSSIFRK